MSRFVSKYAKCPFYHRNDDNRICCEGTDKNNTVNVVFGSKKELLNYQKCYCNDIDNYKRCLISAALDAKWREDQNG